MIDLTKQYKAKGKTPWAAGAQGDDNSWTLTDWFEQIYVRQAGPEKYSQLFETGEVKFNDQSVKDALNEMIKIVNDQYMAGGIDTALGISFVDSIGRVFGKNPKAELFYEGGFVGGIAIDQVNPSLKPGNPGGNPVVGGGDVASARTSAGCWAARPARLSQALTRHWRRELGCRGDPGSPAPPEERGQGRLPGDPARRRPPARRTSAPRSACRWRSSEEARRPSPRARDGDARRGPDRRAVRDR